jgi:type IV secretion system protein VirB8
MERRSDAVGVSEKDEYFAIARRFDTDAVSLALGSARRAWIVAGCAAGIATAAVGAVAAMSPLKTVEPFVIRVDNATGIVDVVSALTGPKSYDDATTKYFAGKYVRSREEYVASEADHNFRAVALMSSPHEQQRFADFYRGSNPLSPQIVYGRSAAVRVQIKSISMVAKNVASIRYLRTVSRSEEVKTSHWIATMTFAYSGEAMSAGDRLINPLGFLVSEYKPDPEAYP